jgi:Cu+-exporting ATPase
MNTSTDTASHSGTATSTDLDLNILGMTCAACVRRIEDAVTNVPGVRAAHVNLITRKASVQYDVQRTSAETVAQAVRNAGYEVADFDSARRAAASGARVAREDRARTLAAAEQAELFDIKRDLVLAASLTVPALVLAMSHGLIRIFEGRWTSWTQFALITPVLFGPGRRFLRGAWTAWKHRTSDMNTLVSMGALDEHVRLRLVRKDYGPCTREVIFPKLNLKRALPTGQPVTIDLPALAPGEYEFKCGMNMIKGVLIVTAAK